MRTRDVLCPRGDWQWCYHRFLMSSETCSRVSNCAKGASVDGGGGFSVRGNHRLAVLPAAPSLQPPLGAARHGLPASQQAPHWQVPCEAPGHPDAQFGNC